MAVTESKEKWNKILSNLPYSQFLQSWEWGQFQNSLGKNVYRQNLGSNLVQIIEYRLPFNKSYLYIPRGPIFRSENPEFFLEQLKNFARKKGAILLRLEPINLNPINLSLNQIKKINDIQPSLTWLIDLSQTEEEILKQMHYKTRYNIRLAQRKKVKIFSGEKKDLGWLRKKFIELIKKTAEKNHFKPYPENYYLKMIENLFSEKFLSHQECFLKIYYAKYDNQIIAANLIIYFGDTASYVHGGSLYKFRHLMAPHLLHWKIIQEAKKQGYRFYDFWGISEEKKSWQGLTRFKKSFGGFKKKYPGSFDLVLDKRWYKIYRIGKIFLSKINV